MAFNSHDGTVLQTVISFLVKDRGGPQLEVFTQLNKASL